MTFSSRGKIYRALKLELCSWCDQLAIKREFFRSRSQCRAASEKWWSTFVSILGLDVCYSHRYQDKEEKSIRRGAQRKIEKAVNQNAKAAGQRPDRSRSENAR